MAIMPVIGAPQGVAPSPYAAPGVGSQLMLMAGQAAVNRYIGPTTSTGGGGVPVPYDYPDAATHRTYSGRRRRRRRRLLTSSDKADIAYLVGQLGTGQIGRAAISALLSKRC